MGCINSKNPCMKAHAIENLSPEEDRYGELWEKQNQDRQNSQSSINNKCCDENECCDDNVCCDDNECCNDNECCDDNQDNNNDDKSKDENEILEENQHTPHPFAVSGRTEMNNIYFG